MGAHVGRDGRCSCGETHAALAEGSPCPRGADGRNLLASAEDYQKWLADGGQWAPAPAPVTAEEIARPRALCQRVDLPGFLGTRARQAFAEEAPTILRMLDALETAQADVARLRAELEDQREMAQDAAWERSERD